MSQKLAVDPRPSSATESPPPPRPRLSPPSERDLLVYKRVKIWRDPQWAVSVDLQLHYSRVSQIVKKVEQWLLAGGSPTDPEIRDHVARRRLSRADHKLRLQRAVELATAAMETEPQPQTTIRRRTVQGTEVWREETTRQPAAVNLAAVRLLVRTTEALHKLEEQEEHRASEEPLPEHDLLPAVFELLCRWRNRAEADGRLPATSDANAVVASALNALLGTQLGPPAKSTLETTSEPAAQESGRGRESLAVADDPPPPTPSRQRLPTPSLHDTVETSAETSTQEALNLSADAENAADAIGGDETSCDDSLADIAEKFPEFERPNWATAVLRRRRLRTSKPESQNDGQTEMSPPATVHSAPASSAASHEMPLTETESFPDELHSPPRSDTAPAPTAASVLDSFPPLPEAAACT